MKRLNNKCPNTGCTNHEDCTKTYCEYYREELTNMMPDEFKNYVKFYDTDNKVRYSDADYKIIETVYNYHPSITDKDCIAKLFVEFGMPLMMDMYPRAKKIGDMEYKRTMLQSQIHELDLELDALYKG